MLDYPAAAAVAMVVQTGSFDAAARALHVTPSAISQRVKQLEERLGTVLIERGTPCTATPKGEWLCRHVQQVGMLEKELGGLLPGLTPADDPAQRVTLNVAINADTLAIWFPQAVAAFTQQSDYLVNITLDDQDHTAEWLQRGRVLAAVTALKKPVQGCHVTPLGGIRYHATASPEFMARYFPGGVTAGALARAPGLTFNQKDRLQHHWIRKTIGRSVAYPTHWTASTQSFVDFCLLGLGWGLNPEQLVKPHLASGRLVELVPGATLTVPLFWQISRLARERLSALTGCVVKTAKKALRPEGGF